MAPRNRGEIESDERSFFAGYYRQEKYNATGWRLRFHRELANLRRQSGRKNLGRVLSIGCGAGEFEVLLASMAEQVTGIDLSPEAIDVAKRRAEAMGTTNVDFQCLSTADLRWEEQFDGILCMAFLHHVPEAALPAFLATINAHIRPGGFFYSQDPNVRGILRKLGRLTLRGRYDTFHTPDERELDPRELRTLLRQAGFAAVKTRAIDLTVIPVSFVMANKPGWPMYLCYTLDWLFCHSPLAPWCSGFTAFATKAEVST